MVLSQKFSQFLVARPSFCFQRVERGLGLAPEQIVAAIGFRTDGDLIASMGFKDGGLNKTTLETSLRGVYNLGLGGISPWTRTGRGLLQTAIEDSMTDVQSICKAIVASVAAKRGR